MDMHGNSDTTVPANVSLSGDGYYYTPTAEIFGGGKYSKGWKAANGCSGANRHYPTRFDGQKKMYCIQEGECRSGDVVRCAWAGGHDWYGTPSQNGGMIVDFLLQWQKPSHLGGGHSALDLSRDQGRRGKPLAKVTVVDAEPDDPAPWKDEIPLQGAAALAEETPGGVSPKKHYGNPRQGCRSDEDAVRVGSLGHACAPKVSHKGREDLAVGGKEGSSVPRPNCTIGGVGTVGQGVGCPHDARLPKGKAPRPVCLAVAPAKRSEEQDPYMEGDFHCLLSCPCSSQWSSHGGKGKRGPAGKCSKESHSHCPQGARCVRGMLRNMGYGLCTYGLV